MICLFSILRITKWFSTKLYHCILLSTVHLGPYCSLTFYFMFYYFCSVFFFPLRDVMWNLIVVLNYILLLISDINHVLMCLLFSCVSSFRKCLFKVFANFWIDLSVFCCCWILWALISLKKEVHSYIHHNMYDLEGTMVSEISQSQKDKYYMISLLWVI